MDASPKSKRKPTYEEDIVASLRKHGYETMCPFCGWSTKEPGHVVEECEQASKTLEGQ